MSFPHSPRIQFQQEIPNTIGLFLNIHIAVSLEIQPCAKSRFAQRKLV
jgi:hypothetical protein